MRPPSSAFLPVAARVPDSLRNTGAALSLDARGLDARGLDARGARESQAATGTRESASRPEPGLARGVWEAPAWAFWAALAIVLAAATLYARYALGRTRKLTRGSAGRKRGR